MIKVEKSIEIDAPAEAVFAYLIDPARMPEYFIGIDEVKDIQRLPDDRYTYTVVSKILGMRLESKSEHLEVVPNERLVEKTQSALAEFTQFLRFERLETGKTRVSVDGEYTLRGAGPLAMYGEPYFARYIERGTETIMQALKARFEAETLAPMPG